tara:strand:+ start:121 stop:945 length:825 start_codon:yes stop_codon:yes gene_type:complete
LQKNIFFNSSLPRSGSTLFSNIIGQDKRFYVTPTSGLASLILQSKELFSQRAEFKAQDENLMNLAFQGFCYGAIQGYFKNITNKVYVLDDSRDWAVNYEFLNSFYKNPKIVSLIRNPIDIFCSMEQQFRKNFLQHSNIQNMVELKNTSLEKRIDYWANTIPIGLSFERLHEVIRFGYYKNFLFIKYEDLCINKQIEINKFYEFINVEPNNVDFKNIKQITKEDDSILLLDHTIRPKLEFNISKAEEILGKKLIEYIQYKYAWFYEFFNYEIKFF